MIVFKSLYIASEGVSCARHGPVSVDTAVECLRAFPIIILENPLTSPARLFSGLAAQVLEIAHSNSRSRRRGGGRKTRHATELAAADRYEVSVHPCPEGGVFLHTRSGNRDMLATKAGRLDQGRVMMKLRMLYLPRPRE